MRLADPQVEQRRSWRWRDAVVLAVLALTVLAGVWWYSGGERIGSGGRYSASGAVAPGETLYLGHPLDNSGPAELRSVSVRPIDQLGPLELDVEPVLVRVPPGVALPLSSSDLTGFEIESVSGAVVDGSDPEAEDVAMVMVGMTASDVGAWRTNGIEVTYRSGVHPSRTAVIEPTVCFLVTPEPDLHVGADEVPAGVDPDHWALYRSC